MRSGSRSCPRSLPTRRPTCSRAPGRTPTPAETADALVDGFHVAWLGSAIFLAAGAVLLFALLRRGDVLAVAHGEEAPVVT